MATLLEAIQKIPRSIVQDLIQILTLEPEEPSVEIDKPRVEFIRGEINRLRRRRIRQGRLSKLYLVSGFVLVIVTIVLLVFKQFPSAGVSGFYGWAFLLVPILRSSASLDFDIRTMESELDLLESTSITADQRAERLFKQHQYELKQYYDQTLGHSKWIFFIGVVCIFVGFGIIGVTFALVSIPGMTKELSEKILISSLGAIGGVLANFIAVIYLKMFSETVKTVGEFHNRLVLTHNLYFSNFMVTKVINEQDRDGVVVAIAKEIIKVH